MTQTEIERLQELRQKEQLTEKEFAQWEFLEKQVINIEGFSDDFALDPKNPRVEVTIEVYGSIYAQGK